MKNKGEAFVGIDMQSPNSFANSRGRYETVQFCYATGPTGYVLCRQILSLGPNCIFSRALVDSTPTSRSRKTNRRDAQSMSMAPRILAVASGGGHWVQMRRLAEAFEGLDVAYVSVREGYAAEVAEHRFYAVRDATRWDRLKLLVLAAQLVRILLTERPAVVVSTGAAPGAIALVLARYLCRSKTIWIDSIANCERMSSSGRHARWVADVWLTQWPQLRKDGGPDYWGAVL